MQIVPMLSDRLGWVSAMLATTHDEQLENLRQQKRLAVEAQAIDTKLQELRREKHDLQDRIKRANAAIAELANG